MSQINRENKDTEIVLGYDDVKKLSDLLPYQFWTSVEKSEKFRD